MTIFCKRFTCKLKSCPCNFISTGANRLQLPGGHSSNSSPATSLECWQQACRCQEQRLQTECLQIAYHNKIDKQNNMKNSNNSSTILVAGATGYLGSEICRQLIAKNKNVKGLVRTTSDSNKVSHLKQSGVEL